MDALRIPVLNFFLRSSERYTVVALDEKNQSIQKEFENIRSGIGLFIPDSYDLVAENISEHGSMQLVYQDENEGVITLSVKPASGQLVMDTETVDMQRIKINEMDALFVEKDGFHVVWMNPEKGLSYDLFAKTLDDGQFWKIVYALAS